MRCFYIKDIVTFLNDLFPQEAAEQWDTNGLCIGDRNAPLKHILLSVDITQRVVDQAVALGCQMILTHHPLFLKPVHSIDLLTYRGHLAHSLILAKIALFNAHTNADASSMGPTFELMRAIGCDEGSLLPIVPADFDIVKHIRSGASNDQAGPSEAHLTHAASTVGTGAICSLKETTSLKALAYMLKSALAATSSPIRIIGDLECEIKTIACCSGSGGFLLSHPAVCAADVYITSDLRHHTAQDAKENAGFGGVKNIIDISHYGAEQIWLLKLADTLTRTFPGVKCTVSDVNTDPWDAYI